MSDLYIDIRSNNWLRKYFDTDFVCVDALVDKIDELDSKIYELTEELEDLQERYDDKYYGKPDSYDVWRDNQLTGN